MASDILTNTEGDLLLKGGNLVFGESDSQNLEALLKLNIGELRLNPLLGCDLIRLTNGRINPQIVLRDINLCLKADAWRNIKTAINGSDIKVDATR